MSWLKFTPEFIEAVERWDGTFTAPAPENRKKTSLRVYENDFVEKVLARAHPIVPGLWALPLGAFGLYKGLTQPALSTWQTLSIFGAGILLWTLLEYFLHRVVFHLDPGEKFSSKVRMFMFHGYHHEFPNDKYRLVAPPMMSWPVTAVIAALYYGLAGPLYWLPLLGGTAIGYLCYDWMHYYTHHFRPKWGPGKYMRRFHMIHHFKDWDRNHGLSSPLWDIVFGTLHTKKHPPAKGATLEDIPD